MKELRSTEINNNDSRLITGYALVFNSPTDNLGDFTEIIEPTALDGVLEVSDVLALLNHDESRGVLARYRNGQGSLKLYIDENGLRYEFEAPHTALGDEVIEGIKRGDITNSSFAFTVEDDDWTNTDGHYTRIIKKISKLYDVSMVYHPAYDATSVNLRGLDKIKKKEELDIYYGKLKSELK